MNSQAIAPIVTIESTIIIRPPAMPWSAAGEMPQRSTLWRYQSYVGPFAQSRTLARIMLVKRATTM